MHMRLVKRSKETGSKVFPPSGSRPRSTRRHSVNKEIGVVMLILAADAVSEFHIKRASNDDLLSTERLAIEMGLPNLPKTPTGTNAETPSHNKKVTSDVEGCSSSAGDSDSVAGRTNNYEEDYSFPHPLLHENVLLSILRFLPWQDVLRTRGVNKSFLRHSLSFVSLCRLPYCGTPAIFIPSREDFQANEATVEAELSPGRSQWKCAGCGFVNYTRATCGNISCQLPRGTQCGQRMFLGQLRRDGTVPMVKWLMHTVFQASETLMSVENHRNKTTNRGKGCAWVTVREEAAATELRERHHRVFFDTLRGVEGVWIVPRGYEKQLAEAATYTGSLPDRPKYMPRNTLVVEKPLSAIQTDNRSPSEPTISPPRKQTPPPPYEFSTPTSSSPTPSHTHKRPQTRAPQRAQAAIRGPVPPRHQTQAQAPPMPAPAKTEALLPLPLPRPRSARAERGLWRHDPYRPLFMQPVYIF